MKRCWTPSRRSRRGSVERLWITDSGVGDDQKVSASRFKFERATPTLDDGNQSPGSDFCLQGHGSFFGGEVWL